MGKRTIALVTVYNPDEQVVKNVRNFADQVDYVAVFDNSKDDNSHLFSSIDNLRYYTQKKNLGLPVAFNIILRDTDFGWNDDDFIIFFDQDSQIRSDHIKKLRSAFCKVESYYNIGCMGPVYYNTSQKRIQIPRLKKQLIGKNYQVKNIITSSMISRYKYLKNIDFWNDNLFLDYADWDLCWRLERNGRICVTTEEVVFQHSVGRGVVKKGPIRLRLGEPYREYYQTRDTLYLLKKDYVPLKMRLQLLKVITIRPILHIKYLDHPKERKAYIKRGWEDYRKGIRGEYRG